MAGILGISPEFMSTILTTDRLILRDWKEEDILLFCEICADPQVMEFMPALLSEAETRRMVIRILKHFDNNGFLELGFDKIYSFTSIHNLASQRVMQKLGMNRLANFIHPQLPQDHYLSEHVLYYL